MKRFNFFRGNVNKTIPHLRRWVNSQTPGTIHWLQVPNAVLFYMDAEEDSDGDFFMPSLHMQLRSIQQHSQMQHITSIDSFMEENSNKLVMAYQFIDHRNGGLTWDAQNFHNAPRDRPMIFRGIVKDLIPDV